MDRARPELLSPVPRPFDTPPHRASDDPSKRNAPATEGVRRSRFLLNATAATYAHASSSFPAGGAAVPCVVRAGRLTRVLPTAFALPDAGAANSQHRVGTQTQPPFNPSWRQLLEMTSP